MGHGRVKQKGTPALLSQIALNISGAANFLIPMPFAEKVKLAQDLGLSSVEFHPYQEWRGEAGPLFGRSGRELTSVLDLCRQLDRISIHAIVGPTIVTVDPKLRAKRVAGNKMSIVDAALLGAEVVVIHCRMAEITQLDVMQRVRPVLTDLAEYGAALGVRIAVETPTDLRHPDHFVSLMETFDHPNLGATLDTGHLLGCLGKDVKDSEDLPEKYNDVLFSLARDLLALGKLSHVHLNDIVADTLKDHYGMGIGFVDFRHVLGLAQDGGYRGIYVLEIHRGPNGVRGSLTHDECREAVELIKGFVA